MKGLAGRGNQLAFGSFGIKSLQSKWITGRQIEAARIAVTRYMQRQGQIWIRIFPDKPITKKPAEVRMGKGKGSPEGFVAPVTPGRIILEVEGVPYEIAKEALRLAAQKLPVTTELLERIEAEAVALNRMEINHSITPLDNPAQIKALRRTIARMKGEVRQRELNNK